MKFNASGEKENSLYHHTLSILGIPETDTTTYLVDGAFTRSANVWYRNADTWIWEATATWEFDDKNYTDLPVATTALVAAQQDYTMPSTARKIDRVEVLDSSGNYRLIKPIDKSQIKSQAMSEYYETDGFPREYDLVGRSILLYPAPAAGSVTLAAGLKLYYSRDIYAFVTTDTDKEPGFDNHFHPIISLGAALDFCITNGINHKKAEIIKEITKLKDELKEFYSMRHRDMPTRIIPNVRGSI